MADPAIDMQASNLFGLASGFYTQSSGTTVESTNVNVLDEFGNVACEKNILDITNYTQTARYCKFDFVTDLGTLLTQFGNVSNGKVVTNISINMTAGDYCSLTISGHNHDTNAHEAGIDIGYADLSNFLPHETLEAFEGWNGFGVPDFGITLGESSPTSATVTFSMTHVDQIDADGKHLVGKNITPRAELSMEFSGIPTNANDIAALQAELRSANTNTMLGVYVDSTDLNDASNEFDSFAFTAHSNASLATV